MMLHLGRNYICISVPEEERDKVDDPDYSLFIDEGMSNKDLAEALESFARFLRANRNVEFDLSGYID